MRMMTTADINPILAAALGRFSQASAQLERMAMSAIIRLLPITEEMGAVLFAGNSAQRNREILEGLLRLEEVPISADWRKKLRAAIPKVRQSQEDRNRLLHNVIDGGSINTETRLIVTRASKNGHSAYEITIEEIDAWTVEASELSMLLGTVPHAEYDLSIWGKGWTSYDVNDWPGRKKE